MDLSRSWARHLFRASGLALLVPGTVVAAFLVLALAGGFGHLGTFRQIIAGPSVSRSNRSGGGVSVTSDTLAAALAASAQPVSQASSSPAGRASVAGTHHAAPRVATHVTAAGAGTPAATSATPTSPAATGAGTRGAGGAGTRPRSGSSSGTAQTHPTDPETPTTPSTSSPKGLAGTIANVTGAVNQTTATVAAVAGDVPPPVGPVAAGAVSSVGSTVTKILGKL